ncbi:hypothetical protein [Streptomyces sp. URMC 124]|uniref:hypothetical protein n=1 Tax=Streptomyces sp. URMC 124 TaxID=3423405 RepID=UPI003F1BF8E5
MHEPLPPGTRVFHAAQQWACRLPGGTAEIIRAEGPDHHGEYEYLVRTGTDFSRKPGPDNPDTDERWWSSRATSRAA